MEQVKTIERW